jgi:hypothetical protein
MTVGFGGFSISFETALSPTSIAFLTATGQTSPDKMRELSLHNRVIYRVPRTIGLRCVVPTCPGISAFYDVSVRRLTDLPLASFRPFLTEVPLP